jgi:hypothetical protein
MEALRSVTLIPENGFNQSIDLSCSELPQGTTCSFNLTPGKAANLMVTLICESFRGSRSAILGRQRGLGAKQLKVGPEIERLGLKRIIRGWKGLSSY